MHLSSRPPLARIARIDQTIRAEGWPNACTLAAQLEVSSRTVQRDLLFLRDRLQAPLAFDPVRNGYYYTDVTYQLPFFQLTEGELVALFLAERLLRQYRGTPFEDELSRAFTKITAALSESISLDLSKVADTLSITPTDVPVQDVATWRLLCGAVLRRRRVEMEYWTASRGELTRRVVDPYHLTRIDNDWYLIGYCHQRQDVRMFAAVRVRSVHETGETFSRPADFRVEGYLGDSFRAVRGEGRHRVVLRFAPAVAGRVAEKVWHRSQTTKPQPDGSLLLRLQVSDLREVKRWVLGWGADCTVLQPAGLRRMVREELQRTLQSYS